MVFVSYAPPFYTIMDQVVVILPVSAMLPMYGTGIQEAKQVLVCATLLLI
jgi:hypothetical protein